MIAVNLLPSIALVLLVCRLVKRYIVRRIYFKLIATGEYAGHGYVDMGLSVKWATCNVGADSPNDYGNYYAWGETETKSSYDEGNCETWKKKIGDIGGTIRDVAHAEWGGGWRMPTVAEFEELRHNCIWTWGTLMVIKVIRLGARRPVTGYFFLLPVGGAGRRSTVPVRSIASGIRCRSRASFCTRAARTSAAAIAAACCHMTVFGYPMRSATIGVRRR